MTTDLELAAGERGIKYFLVSFTDLFGAQRAKLVPAAAIGEMVRQAFADLPGVVECGELGVREEARGLVLPTAIWARWSNPSPP